MLRVTASHRFVNVPAEAAPLEAVSPMTPTVAVEGPPWDGQAPALLSVVVVDVDGVVRRLIEVDTELSVRWHSIDAVVANVVGPRVDDLNLEDGLYRL